VVNVDIVLCNGTVVTEAVTLPLDIAVRDGRIHIFTEEYIMQPGPHLAEVAERFAAALHPGATTTAPTTRGAS